MKTRNPIPVPGTRTALPCFALLLLIGCAGSGSKGENAEMMTAENFIPLAVGNQWVYNYGFDESPSRLEVTVVGTTSRGEKEWFQVVQTFDGKPAVDTMLLRNEGHRHITYLASSKSELVLIDFSLTKMDSIMMETSFVKERNKSVEVEGKTYSGCVVVNPAFVDGEVGTYAPGVGLVEAWWFRGRKRLVSARIAEHGSKR